MYILVMVFSSEILRDLLIVRKTLLVIIIPIVLLPLPLVADTSEAKCGYGLLLMAILWITESLPLAVTALLPVLIFPLFGVVKVGDVCANYIKDTSMFGIGGLSVAIAIEKWNLHKRIALRALMTFGSEPKWLMFGFMLPTWFLSMWVSNTATTAMMIPIVGAVVQQLRDVHSQHDDLNEAVTNGCQKKGELNVMSIEMTEKYTPIEDDTTVKGDALPSYQSVCETEETRNGNITDIDLHVKEEKKQPDNAEEKEYTFEDSPEYVQICKGMSLCVAYAANVGGTSTLSGTGPNLIMQGQTELWILWAIIYKNTQGKTRQMPRILNGTFATVRRVFNKYNEENPINFASWMIFGLPCSLCCVVLAWVWLQLLFLGWRELLCCGKKQTKQSSKVQETIRKEYEKLGSMTFAEISVLVHFVLLIVLWFARKPPYVDGWGSFFPDGFVGDSAAAILICLSMYTFPSERPAVLCFGRQFDDRVRESVPSILDWPTVEKKFPWGVLLLIGGGYALADACERSGLSELIGNQLTVFGELEPWVMTMLLTVIVAFLTEVTSNSATTTLLLPILAKLAENLGLNPLYLMFPCTIAASFAFMLPVATPPNAIVFANGYLQVKDMAKAGFGMNIICLIVLTIGTNTWGDAYFNFKTLPQGFLTATTATTRLNATTTAVI